MRTRTTLLIAACFAALATAPANAQIDLGVAGGPSFPVGDLADVVGPGVHGGLTLRAGLPLLPIGLRADAMYQRLPGSGDLDNYDQFFGTLNATFSVLPIPLLSAYLTGGAGLYSSTYDVVPGEDSGRSVDAGINFGVGGRVNLIVVRPFVEARYHRMLSDPARAFIPITVGITF